MRQIRAERHIIAFAGSYFTSLFFGAVFEQITSPVEIKKSQIQVPIFCDGWFVAILPTIPLNSSNERSHLGD